MNDADIIVVGAGHNGLVAATYLARSGLRVQIVEKRPWVGGCAITEELWPGFRFSTCAHLIHAIHPKIMRDFKLRERGLKWMETPATIYLREDGTYYGPNDYISPRNRCAANLQTAKERKAEYKYNAFKSCLNRIFSPYRLCPPPSLEELLKAIEGTTKEGILKRALETKLWDLQEQFFQSSFQLDQYAWEGAASNRNPLALALAYNSIEEPEKGDGNGEKPAVGFVRGGMGELSRLLLNNAQEAGVTVHCNQAVSRFLVQDGAVTGVALPDGREMHAPRVLSNLDPIQTLTHLAANHHFQDGFLQNLQKIRSNVSCLKLLAVVKELPKWTHWDGNPDRIHEGAVRLGVSRRLVSAAYDDLEAGRPPKHPIMSVNFPSFKDPSLAQEGYHTASVWIFPAPAQLKDGSWDDVREEVTENLIDRITDYAPNFRSSIVHKKLRTPLDLERDNFLTDGCIWHIQHEGELLFWNRPLPELSQYRTPLKGLYLCGAGQHPGGEVSGLPGHNAAHEILKEVSGKARIHYSLK